MRATQICVDRRWRDSPAVFMLQGITIQQDGSVTSHNLGGITDVEEFSSRGPQTMYHVLNAADELVEQIRSEADRAAEEIRSRARRTRLTSCSRIVAATGVSSGSLCPMPYTGDVAAR